MALLNVHSGHRSSTHMARMTGLTAGHDPGRKGLTSDFGLL